MVNSYRDLLVWQRGMDLVESVYQVTRSFPRHEVYGLTAQLRRAAVSVPSNIAEGHGRRHLGDYLHHLSIANGSLFELETHLLLAQRLTYVLPAEAETASRLSGEVGRMLAGLARALRRGQSGRVARP